MVQFGLKNTSGFSPVSEDVVWSKGVKDSECQNRLYMSSQSILCSLQGPSLRGSGSPKLMYGQSESEDPIPLSRAKSGHRKSRDQSG